jgi:hypothetical protein
MRKMLTESPRLTSKALKNYIGVLTMKNLHEATSSYMSKKLFDF